MPSESLGAQTYNTVLYIAGIMEGPISKLIITLCYRYDGGANIIAYDNCSSTYNASTPDHRDLRPNYCPTKSYKRTLGKEPKDKDVMNWANSERFIDRVYIMQYTTEESKFNIMTYK